MTAAVAQASESLPDELKLAARVMFAIEPGYPHRFLRQRYDALAELWNCDFRTVQRRCDEAMDLIVDQLAERVQPMPSTGRDDVFEPNAWYVESLRSVVLLNRPQREALEERTLVATVDGLSRLGVPFGVPRHPREERPRLGLDIEVVYGVAADSVERLGENMFVQYLTLPRPLRHGERHTYVRTIRIPSGQKMVPRYTYLPVHRCDLFELRVKFALDALPRVVWVVSRVPEMVYTSHQPGRDLVEPDALGEVCVRFTDLQLGFGYGLAWLPADGDHE